jgi:small subunit ribosomal protein S8e
MVFVQQRSRRKHSGGRFRNKVVKRKYAIGRKPTHTKIGENHTQIIRTKGGDKKTRILHSNTVNIAGKGNTTIKAVLENPANRHFVRSNIITKGTVLDTEAGKATVTSRPGQDGSVDAVLLK